MIAGLSLLGRQQGEDYLDVDGVKYPLPRKPEGLDTLEEWDLLRTTPLEPFQAATVLGDDSLISDDRISSAVFGSDTFSGGIGVRRYKEIEGLSGYQDGDLLSLEGVLTSPLFPESVGTVPVNIGTNPRGFGLNWTAQYQFLVWAPSTVRPYVWNSVGAAFETLTGPPVGAMSTFASFNKLGQYYVGCWLSGIWYSTDGKNWTQGWTPGGGIQLRGLVKHNNNLYVLVAGEGGVNTMRFRWISTEAQLTAGVGVAWPGVGVDTNFPGGNIHNIVNWTDENTGDTMIYLVDAFRVYGYSDNDYWIQYWDIPDAHQSYQPYIWVNPRDNLLYVGSGRAKSIYALNHQTIDEVGPNKGFGLSQQAIPGDFVCTILDGNTRFMFALGYPTDTTGTGRIMVAGDNMGWSPLMRGPRTDDEVLDGAVTASTSRIKGMFYFDQWLVTIKDGGLVQRIFFPDEPFTSYRGSGVAPTAYPWGKNRTGGYSWAYSPEFDAGNETLYKLLKYFRILAERQVTAAPGLPSGGGVKFKYQIDGGSWTTPVTILPGAGNWPAVLPIPSANDQRGTQFRKLRWAIGVQSNGSSTWDTAIIRGIIVGLTKEPDIYDGLQCVIDLSDARWRDEEGNPIKEFYGRDRKELRALIETLKSGPSSGTKRHYPVTIGANGQVKSYASCDIRVSGSTDPNTDYGKFTFTMRALDAPPSG